MAVNGGAQKDDWITTFSRFQGTTEATIRSVLEKLQHLEVCEHETRKQISDRLGFLEGKVDKLSNWRHSVIGGLGVAALIFSALLRFTNPPKVTLTLAPEAIARSLPAESITTTPTTVPPISRPSSRKSSR